MKRKGGICLVEYAPEEYTRHYIVEALFRLMEEYEYEKIGVTDIAAKAGVGRATFYRYFKRKEDVIVYYLEHGTRDFLVRQRYFPRCRADYLKIATGAFTMFKEHREAFRLLARARLEYLYLDYLNKKFLDTFESDYAGRNAYAPYVYAGMLFNASMAWLKNGCTESAEDLAQTLVDAIVFES